MRQFNICGCAKKGERNQLSSSAAGPDLVLCRTVHQQRMKVVVRQVRLNASRLENSYLLRQHAPKLSGKRSIPQSRTDRNDRTNPLLFCLPLCLGRLFSITRSVNTMPKTQRSNREPKKQSLLTPKEKKAAKRAKKHAGDVTPLIIKPS